MDRISSMSVDKSHSVLQGIHRLSSGFYGATTIALILIFGFSGCCTPFGPGCHDGNCYDCDGATQYIPMAPFQGLKQRLTCGGGGCGEVYIGEWISTPPDCPDPCCDDQFVGGANKCSPGCWTLGSLFDWRRFSGRYDGGRCCDVGCCDASCDGGCDSCCGDGYIGEETYFDAGEVQAPVYQGGSSGCSTCSARGATGRTQFAANRSTPRSNQPTRYAADQGRLNRDPATTRLASNSSRPVAQSPRSTNSASRSMNGTTRQSSTMRQANLPQNSRPVSSAPRTGNSRNRVADQSDREVQRIRR